MALRSSLMSTFEEGRSRTCTGEDRHAQFVQRSNVARDAFASATGQTSAVTASVSGMRMS